MATMRIPWHRVELRWIGLWLFGLLCGVGLMLGVTLVHQGQQQATVGDARQTQPVANPVVSAPAASDIPAPASTDTIAGQSTSAAPVDTSHDLPRLDEETYYRIDTRYDLPQLDEEAYYRNLSAGTGFGAPPPFDHLHASDAQ